MKTVQTIELSDDERTALEKALHLIDRISDTTNVSMSDIFDYFVDNSDLTYAGRYIVKPLHNIEDMR